MSLRSSHLWPWGEMGGCQETELTSEGELGGNLKSLEKWDGGTAEMQKENEMHPTHCHWAEKPSNE